MPIRGKHMIHCAVQMRFLALCAQSSPAVAAAGDWPMASKDYANTRYSELDQITADNAKDLKLAFTFSTGTVRGHEAAPIVAGATIALVIGVQWLTAFILPPCS